MKRFIITRLNFSFILLAIIMAVSLLSRVSAAAAHQKAHESKLARYEYTEYHMGVDVHIIVYAQSKAQAESGCAAAFERFAQLDTIMSDYQDQSELNRLCEKAGGPPVKVSPELFRVLERSQLLAQQSDGGFDVTCSPIVRLWRKARKDHVLPTQEQLDSARAVVGWRYMKLDSINRTVELKLAGMKLDLGAIGKGYADDFAQEVLRRHGIRSALVEAGGDIVVSDAPPGEVGWKIKAEVKADNLPGTDPRDRSLMRLHNCAISTSGDTEQFVEIGGKRYSHVVDPRTGQALTNRLAILVIARDGLTSDGVSTAVSVVGEEKGRALVKLYPGARVWVGRD
jgi:thiamine biosynthesis lipoprotein